MKKNYLILLLSVVLALSALLFPACKPQEQSESAKPPTVSGSAAVQPEAETESPAQADGRELISSFETYDEVVQMRMLNSFGKMQDDGAEADRKRQIHIFRSSRAGDSHADGIR